MGEGFSSTRSAHINNSCEEAQLQELSSTMKQAFPVYIVTSATNSPDVSALMKYLEIHNIAVSVQHSGQRLQLLPNSYQRRCFVVLCGMTRSQAQFQNQDATHEIVSYLQSKQEDISTLYRRFIAEQLLKISITQSSVLQPPIQRSPQRKPKAQPQQQTKVQPQQQVNAQLLHSLKAQPSHYAKSQQKSPRTSHSAITKSLVKLKKVSKMIYNYKSLWPKQLFIYSNRHDDTTFQKYVSLIRNMSFDNACFISHIQDYIKYLPQKGDVSFSVLMSQYSVLNLRKYFKGADQILLFCENSNQCLPLLRGKVSYFTTEAECLDKLLVQKYGMKENSLQLQHKQQKGEHIQQQKLSLQNQQSLKQKISSVEQFKYPCQKSNQKSKLLGSILHFDIFQQYSLITRPQRSLKLQSNTIAYNYDHTLNSSQAESKENIRSDNQMHTNCRKKQTSFHARELNQKWTPLKIVQLQMPSLANITLQSSEVSQERQLFQELINKLENEESIEHITQIKVEHRRQVKEELHLVNRQQKHSSFKQNSSNSLKGWGSRFSKGSHNSRILDRMKERQSRVSCKFKTTF